MSLAVIGAGFGRTGTMSIKLALEQLGFGACYHMVEYMSRPEQEPLWQAVIDNQEKNWPAIYTGFQSTLDWPSMLYWRELMDAYPDAKVLLTVRDAKKWWESFSKTILLGLQRPEGSPPRASHEALAARFVIEKTFNGDLSKDNAIRAYEQHNDAVRKGVPASRLLEYNVSEGWQPLCELLNVAIPDTAFPRTNSTDEFLAAFAEFHE